MNSFFERCGYCGKGILSLLVREHLIDDGENHSLEKRSKQGTTSKHKEQKSNRTSYESVYSTPIMVSNCNQYNFPGASE